MKKKILGTLVAAASAVGFLLPAAPASAATQTTADLAYGQLRAFNAGSEQCLVVLSNGSNGNNPSLYDCLNFDDQQWYYPKTGTTGPIINKYSLLYLTAQGYSAGSPAFMYYNSGYPDQQWTAESVAGLPNLVRFRNANSNLCLTVQRNSGARAMQYYCNDYADQEWALW